MGWSAKLTAAQEIPKQAVKNAGRHGAFTGDAHGKKLTWKLTFSKLSGPATAAHIHMGGMGKAGNVVVPLCGPCKSGVQRHGDACRRPFSRRSPSTALRQRAHREEPDGRDPRAASAANGKGYCGSVRGVLLVVAATDRELASSEVWTRRAAGSVRSRRRCRRRGRSPSASPTLFSTSVSPGPAGSRPRRSFSARSPSTATSSIRRRC